MTTYIFSLALFGLFWDGTPQNTVSQTDFEKEIQAFVEQGDLEKAELHCVKHIQVIDKIYAENGKDWDTAMRSCQARAKLAEIQAVLCKFESSDALLQSVSTFLRQAVTQNPKSSRLKLEWAKVREIHARSLEGRWKHFEAEALLKEVATSFRQMEKEQFEEDEIVQQFSHVSQVHAALLTKLARYEDADLAHRAAIDVERQRLRRNPKSPEAISSLAKAVNAYAYLVRESGRYTEAIDLLREACELVASLERSHPNEPKHWHMLPVFYRNMMQPLGYMSRRAESDLARKEADRVEMKLLAMPEAAKKFAASRDRLTATMMRGDAQGFLALEGEVQKIDEETEKRFRPESASTKLLLHRGAGKGMVCVQMLLKGLFESAQPNAVESESCFKRLVELNPHIPFYRVLHAESLYRLGFVYMLLSPNDASTSYIQQGQRLLEQLAKDNPGNPMYRKKIVDLLAAIGMATDRGKSSKEALPIFEKLQQELGILAREFPRCPFYRRHEADTFGLRSVIALRAGDTPLSVKLGEQCVAAWVKTSTDFPEIEIFRLSLADQQASLANLLVKANHLEDAEKQFLAALASLRALCEKNVRQAHFHSVLASNYQYLGKFYEEHQRLTDSVNAHTNAIASYESALGLNPRQREWLDPLRMSLRQRAGHHFALGKFAEAKADEMKMQTYAERTDPPFLRLIRAENRLKSGNWSAAAQEATDLTYVDLSSEELQKTALILDELATAAPDASKRIECQKRSQDCLRTAVHQGMPIPSDPVNPRLQQLLRQVQLISDASSSSPSPTLPAFVK